MALGGLIKNLLYRNFPWRLLFLFLFFLPLLYFNDFYRHFYAYLTGSIITRVFTQHWNLVLASIVFFIIFLIPLSFRRKVNWAEHGLVTAFFISLFIEMYGIPFTLLLSSKYFFTANANLPSHVIGFEILGTKFGMDLAMSYGALLIIIGIFLIVAGWINLYRTIKKKILVTSGVYSISRHPQYFGFILIITGWFIGWPTILTLVMSPILIYKYIQVSKREEQELLRENSEYRLYKEKVPFFI